MARITVGLCHASAEPVRAGHAWRRSGARRVCRARIAVERDNDKNPVVALREIAEGTVELDHLRYELIHGLRRHVEIQEQPDDLMMAYQDQLIEPTPALRPEEDVDFDLGSAPQPTFDDAPEFE